MNRLPFSPLTTQALIDALGSFNPRTPWEGVTQMHIADALTQRITDGAKNYCDSAYAHEIRVGNKARARRVPL